MPFKSEKQRKWMWANDPEMAQEWEDEEKLEEEEVESIDLKMSKKDVFWPYFFYVWCACCVYTLFAHEKFITMIFGPWRIF